MAIVRKSLSEIRAAKPKADRAKIKATTEGGIRRHMIEDGENPDAEPKAEDIFTPAVVRKRLGMTQEQFGAAIGIDRTQIIRWEKGRAKPSRLAQRQIRMMEAVAADVLPHDKGAGAVKAQSQKSPA